MKTDVRPRELLLTFTGDTSLIELEVNKIHFIYGILEHNVLSQVNPPNTAVISLTLLPPAACRFPKHQGGRVVCLQLSEWCELSPACLNLTVSTFATQLKLSFLYPLWKAIWKKKTFKKTQNVHSLWPNYSTAGNLF